MCLLSRRGSVSIVLIYKDPEKQREACRRYYEKNRHVYREKNRRMRQRLQQMIRQAKSVPCMDCGVSYPYYVMDFDHRGEKEGLVSVMINTLSPTRIRAEMAKCDVVCSNCHRIRTYGGRPIDDIPLLPPGSDGMEPSS